MKLAKITYRNLKQDAGHWNLILENLEDVDTYFELIKDQFSKDAIDAWMLMKKHEYKADHFTEGNTTKILGIMQGSLIPEGEELSIVDYTNKMDGILVGKIMAMRKIILNEEPVKVNPSGGYSSFNDMFLTLEEVECDHLQAAEYLKGKVDFLKAKPLHLMGETLVIENDNMLSERLHDFLKENFEDPIILTEFEKQTLGYEQKDFHNMFTSAVNTGLRNIVLETTLIKSTQFNTLKSVLEKVFDIYSNKGRIFNIHILKNGDFPDIETDLENVNIYHYDFDLTLN